MEQDEERIDFEWEWIELTLASIAGATLYLAGYHLPARITLAGLGLLLLARFLIYSLRGKYTVDILMGGVALILSAAGTVLEGFIILAIYGFAETLEEAVEGLATRNISKLMKILPETVTVERDGVRRIIPPDSVRPGDTIVVGKGQVVPVDGRLLSERGVFDTSLVTGEPLPMVVERGGIVYSGYINLQDPVRVKALKRPGESTLQRTIEAAARLLEERTGIERRIEKITPLYTITLLAASLGALILAGLEASVSILLAGCPSAFIITSSVASLSTAASLAGKGVLVKGGRALERLSQVNIVVLDKTGTLTLGKPMLTRLLTNGISERDLISYAAALAASSSHPLSRGIVEAALRMGVEIPVAESVKEVPGEGLTGRVNGVEVRLGRASYTGVEGLECSRADASVYVSVNGGSGVLCFQDLLDDSAKHVIRALKGMGYKVVLASGDRRERVEKIAAMLGVDEWYAGLKPEDKMLLARRLRHHGRVAVVGDGINDLAALAEADASIAVGDVEVVARHADAVLRRGISRLPLLLYYSKGFSRSLFTGFIAAIMIKALTVLAGSLGFFPLWLVAVVGDDGSTLAAVASGLLAFTLHARRLPYHAVEGSRSLEGVEEAGKMLEAGVAWRA